MRLPLAGEAVLRDECLQSTARRPAFFKSYPPNTRGADFVVGDLHGHGVQLLAKLKRLGFDRSRDRLFCTGDLIDRGPDSLGTLKLLLEPWFFAVKGNHEDDLAALLEIRDGMADWQVAPLGLEQNWIYRLSEEELAYLRAILLPKIETTPLVLRVEGELGFWMVHADRGKFGRYCDPLPLVDDERLPFVTDDDQAYALLWSRRLHKQMPRRGLTDQGLFVTHPEAAWEQGVGLTFVGHSYVTKPTLYRSHFYLDTGAGTTRTGRLTVLRVKNVLEGLT